MIMTSNCFDCKYWDGSGVGMDAYCDNSKAKKTGWLNPVICSDLKKDCLKGKWFKLKYVKNI